MCLLLDLADLHIMHTASTAVDSAKTMATPVRAPTTGSRPAISVAVFCVPGPVVDATGEPVEEVSAGG